jgi:hypothetical protein
MDQWLVQEFTSFGIHSYLQNWMLVMAVIVIVGILMARYDRREL